jgi:uncharacterized protein (TIGR02145 family)
MQLFKKKAYTLYYEDECINCVDHDVTIGTQTWTGCNLNVTTYRNGDPIPQVTDQTDWSNLTTGAWCHINNNPANDAIYGKLYNWYAVNDTAHGGLAPLGYHVPSYAEWDILIDSLGGDTVAGGKLKEVGLCHWLSPNTDATDQVLFTALPGGFRGGNGSFGSVGANGQWWTSTEFDTTKAWMKYLLYNYEGVGYGQPEKNGGMSVRLIQDEILSCLNIEVYPPILNPGTSHVVEYLDCDGITQIVTVPNGGTMVTICATEIIANNLNGLTQPLYTICSPSPPEPLDFYIDKQCSGSNLINILLDDISGGVPPYYPATDTFTSEALALANTSWSSTPNPGPVDVSYPETVTNTYWVAVKDSADTVFAKEIYADCWDSLDPANRELVRLSDDSNTNPLLACGYSVNTVGNFYLAVHTSGTVLVGDRLFTTSTGTAVFDGTEGNLNAINYWKIEPTMGLSACVNGTIVSIDVDGYITNVQCC